MTATNPAQPKQPASQRRLAMPLLLALAMAALPNVPGRADPPPAAIAAMKVQGEKLFAERCASCHDAPGSKAPSRAVLAQISVEDIAKILMLGPMAPQAQGLDVQQITAIALYASHKAGRPDPEANANMCKTAPAKLDLAAASTTADWNGWSPSHDNARFQPAPGLAAADVPHLKLKWAFSTTGERSSGQPVVVGGRVFITNLTGRVQSIDARTGCTIWSYEAGTATRTAISVGPAPRGAKIAGQTPHAIAYFGDEAATVHALDAETGKLLWKVRVEDHKAAIITGSPTLYHGRLYVPVASTEEVGSTPPYPCCSFRGSIVALDAANGKQIWKTYMIAQAPKPYKTSKQGVTLMGPAGASVWSSPTIDAKAGRIYAATGNSYSGAATFSSDAIIALDLKTGKRLWANQVLADDNFVVGCYIVKPPVCSFGICNGPGEGNCPDKVGPDHDFGASPILVSLPGGKRMLVAGQKSAWVYGLDPDQNGKLVWKQKVGAGGAAGGIEWGMAADGRQVYAPTSDIYVVPDDKAGGLTALDAASGKMIWQAKPNPVCAWGKQGCTGAQSQAVSAIPGVVFSGAIDGHLRAYDSATGKIIWDYDAGGTVDTVNQGAQSGGSLNHGGPAVSGGMVFVNAGYGRFAGRNGHLLLAFGLQ